VSLAVLPACGPQPPWPQPPAADFVLAAAADRTEVPLLGPVRLSLDLYWRGERSVEFDPRVPEGCRGEVEPAISRSWGGGTWRHVVLDLRPARGPGELRIEPFVARSREGAEAKSDPIMLRVTTVLAAAGPEIEAPGAPFPAPVPWLRWLAIIGGVLAALVLLATMFFRRRARPGMADAVPLQPHAKAMRELARLRSAPRRTPAEIDAFYVAVSSVLRTYLEERFGLRAPERTTEEFLQELDGSAVLAGRQQELRAFLGQCDLVKFAAQVPGEPVHLETLGTAERFVAATRADRVEVAT
jgi:hypothetical protein